MESMFHTLFGSNIFACMCGTLLFSKVFVDGLIQVLHHGHFVFVVMQNLTYDKKEISHA